MACCLSIAIDDNSCLAQEMSAEEKREQIAAERFLELLIRRPTTGTALDRVFGYHVGRGDIGEVVDELTKKAEQAADADESGRHWMVVGLLQLQRSEDAAAVKALEQAEEKLETNALAAYHHGQALLLVGQTDGAAAAMQRAIDLKPPRRDLLNIAGQLGRLYQRSGKVDEALKIWSQLEETFPGDDGVRQRIARILVEEGDTEGALSRYDALATEAKTQNDRIVYALRAADLRARVGKKDQAIEELESLLSKLRPGSYLYDEARRRIEATFLASGDYTGLTEYYQKWVEGHPDDIGAVLRLSRTLAVQGRGAEALEWLEKAIERAPSDVSPRLALVDAYIAQDQLGDAAKQYEELVKMEPQNPDYLVRWGQIVFEDTKQPKPQRTEAAAEIWKRLSTARADDAAIQSQVADLLRGADRVEDALAGYRAAIKLAPEEPQYKEYLGEYLHRLDRKDEAVKVWRSLAEGDLRTRENVVRLAEVFHQFDRGEDALATMAEACQMNPTIDDRLRYADWLRDESKFAEALAQIELAADQTDTFDDRDRVFTAAVQTYQVSGQLKERIEEARKAAEAAESDTELWRRLAVLYNADRQTREALESIETALKIAPESIESLDIAARMYEEAGRLRLAIEKRRQLVDTDQRFRGGHLQRLSSLHLRMGDVDDAITAGRELLAASAGSIEAYQFYADMCGQVGRIDERLDTLRRCVRMNPRSNEAQSLLASQLAEDFKTDQAIELYWKMLDGAEDIEDRRETVTKLTDLYLRSNRLDQLIARLEIRGRESADRRTTIDLVSTAHQQAGDLGLAREALEGLLSESGRDTLLLERLVSLSEQAGEFDEAVELQRQLVRLAPGRQNEARLASLLIDIGAMDEAEAIWLRLSEANADPKQIARNINRLFAAGESKTAIAMTEKMLEADPGDWEMRFKLMVLQADQGDWKAAGESADKLAALKIADTTLPAGGKPYQRTVTSGGRSYRQPPLKMMRYQSLYEFYRVVDERYGYQQSTSLPKPMDFGQAKLMGLYCQLRRDRDDGKNIDELVAELEKKALADEAAADDVWNWYGNLTMVAMINQSSSISYQNPDAWGPLWRLAELDSESGTTLLAQMFMNRSRVFSRPQMQLQKLSDERLEWLRERSESADEGEALNVYSSQASWVEFYGSELRIAGNEEEADKYLKQQLAKALEDPDIENLPAALQQASAHGTDEQLWPLIERILDDTEAQAVKQRYGNYASSGMLTTFTAAERQDKELSKGAKDPEYRKRVIHLLDHLLESEADKPLRRRTIRLTGVGGPRNTYRITAGVYRSMPIEFPPKGLGPDDQFVQAFYGAWDQLKEYSGQWIKSLQQTDEDADPRLKVWRGIAAATLMQWSGRTDDAIKQLETTTELASEEVPNMEPELRLMSADLLLRQDRKREALREIDSLAVYDQNTMALREFAAARLAAAVGDRERARNAAKRLFGVRMGTEAQIELAKLMRQLEMRELASDLVRRMRSRGGSNTDQLQSLMTYFSAQNEKEQAAEVAMELLRRSAPTRRPSSQYTTQNQSRRRSALQTLASSGRLTALIDSTKKRLEKAPKSQRIRSELAEMYAAAGKTAESQELLGGTDLKNVNSAQALETTAQQLVAAGKMDEACDAYLKLLRRRQDSFSRNFYDIKRPFEQQKRMGDLADLMIEVGLQKFDHYRVGEVCEDMIRRKDNVPKAKKLYDAMLEMPPNSSFARNSLRGVMSSARDLLTDQETVEKTLNYMVAVSTSPSSSSTPWQALFEGYSTSSDGRHNNATTYFLRHVKDNKQYMAAVEKKLRETLEEKDDWYEGKAWLALVLTTQEQYDEAKELLEPLLSEDQKPAVTHDVVWLIGSLIDSHKPMQEFAERLYDYGLKNTTDRSTTRDFKYSLKGRICNFMADIGNRSRAREMALEAIKNENKSQQGYPGNEEYEAYRKIRSRMSMIEFLDEIDYPADALQVARRFDRSLFVKSGRYQRDYKERFDKQQQELLDKVRELGGLATVRSMVDLGTEGPNAVDFGITMGERPFTETGLSALLVDLLEEASHDTDTEQDFATLVGEWTSSLEQRPDDDSLAAAHAIAADLNGDRQPLRELTDRWSADWKENAEVEEPAVRNRLLLVCLLRLDRAASGDAADEDHSKASALEPTENVSSKEFVYFLADLGRQATAREQNERGQELWERAAAIGGDRYAMLDLSQAAVAAGMKPLAAAAFTSSVAAPVGQSTLEQQAQASAGSLGQLLRSAQRNTSSPTSSRDNRPDAEQIRLATRILELEDTFREHKMPTHLVYDQLAAYTVGAKGSVPRILFTPLEVKTGNRIVISSVFDRLTSRAKWTKRTDQLVALLDQNNATSQLLAGHALLRDERGKEANQRLATIDASEFRGMQKEMVLQTLLLALENEDCRDTAMDLSLALVEQNKPTQRYQDIEPYETLSLQLAKIAMDHKMNPELADAAIKSYLELTAHDNDRYSSGGTSRRVGQLEEIIKLLLPAGQVERAMNYIAMRQSVFNEGYDRSNDWIGLWALESINGMSDRYAAYKLLADWTFEGDGALRSIRALVRLQRLPEWIPEAVSGPYPIFAPTAHPLLPIASNYHFLARLAAETGQNQDLMSRLEKARAKQRAGSETALAIVLAAREQPVPKELIAEVRRRYDSVKPTSNQPKAAAPLEELQLATMLGSDPKYRDFATHLVVRMYDHSHPVGRPYLHPWYIQFMHKGGLGEPSDQPSTDGLVHWKRSTIASAKLHADGLTPPIWITDRTSQIEHVCGFGQDFLWFRYPLVGNYTVEAEFSDGGFSEGSLVCDGLRFNPHGNHNYVDLRTQGTNDWVRLYTKSMKKNEYKKCTITLDDEYYSCLINDVLVYREKRKSASPWVALLADGDKRTIMRNLRIYGDPKIPREVNMIPDGNLRGWTGEYYGLRLPTHGVNATNREADSNENRKYRTGPSANSLKSLAWGVDNGELVSGKVQKRGPGQQSCIHYERPLCDGETIRYEFMYEEGKTAVFPAIGRTAYVLRPDGVRLHWMTAYNTSWKTPNDFEAPVPGAESKPLPLKSGEWNQLELTRDGDKLKIALNGENVFDGEAKSRLGDMVFGLFHYANKTDARVRNMTLTGSWPEDLPANMAEFREE